jgi:WD40-like Beta Propeller Repeat
MARRKRRWAFGCAVTANVCSHVLERSLSHSYDALRVSRAVSRVSLALLVTLAVPGMAGSSSRAAPKQAQQLIAFAANGIRVISSDGTGQRRLTSGPRDDSPVWSPDGTRLALSERSRSVQTAETT